MIEPELRNFGLDHSQSQHFLRAVQVDADVQVHRFVDDVPVVMAFDHQGIQIRDQMQRIQRLVLPRLGLVDHRIGDVEISVGEISTSRVGSPRA
jgi:hypothetical protein